MHKYVRRHRRINVEVGVDACRFVPRGLLHR